MSRNSAPRRTLQKDCTSTDAEALFAHRGKPRPDLGDGFGIEAVSSAIGTEADQTRRSTIIFLISAIALAGLRPFGQVCAQFMSFPLCANFTSSEAGQR